MKAGLVDGQRLDGDRMQALDGRRHAQGMCPLRELLAGGDHDYPGRCLRGAGIDVADAGMGVRRADESCMQRAGNDKVIDVAGRAGQKPAILPSPELAADWSLVVGRVRGGHAGDLAAQALP
jgi:hypothetical protein